MKRPDRLTIRLVLSFLIKRAAKVSAGGLSVPLSWRPATAHGCIRSILSITETTSEPIPFTSLIDMSRPLMPGRPAANLGLELLWALGTTLVFSELLVRSVHRRLIK